jgi:sodium/potassium-transporting ATPase subunit alpha
MFVTECSIASKIMNPQTARDEMIIARHYEESKINNAIDQLRTVAGLCNAGEFDASTMHLPLSERKINGDATDQAILRFSESLSPVSELREQWTRKFELAFNSKNKFMIRLFASATEAGLPSALPESELSKFGSRSM